MLHLAAWAMGGIDAPSAPRLGPTTMSALKDPTGPAVQWLRPTATDERPTVAKLGPTDSTGTATQLAASAKLVETDAKSVVTMVKTRNSMRKMRNSMGTAIQFATGTTI